MARQTVWCLTMVLVSLMLLATSESAPSAFWGALYPAAPEQTRRRPYQQERAGRGRYNEICRIHAVDGLAFPGRIGNPVCPW